MAPKLSISNSDYNTRIRFETMNQMFSCTGICGFNTNCVYERLHIERWLPHTRPMTICLHLSELTSNQNRDMQFQNQLQYPTFKINVASLSQVWSYEPRNIHIHRLTGCCIVSQSIERRKGWHQKLTKNPVSKKKATLQSCIRRQPPPWISSTTCS
jgi:hypothetical protein